MTKSQLKDIEITNFRSIRGRMLVPLDAQVVLIHGENGAGKTSLLSAIEMALTGRMVAIQRADPNYDKQLLHRGSQSGKILLKACLNGADVEFETQLKTAGADTLTCLPTGMAAFLSERCYLPQTLLGQLLQIYQDSGSGLDSPLSRFVGELLGLDPLDAVESGLKALGDVRNVRKISSQYGVTESEKARLERQLFDHQRSAAAIVTTLSEALAEVDDAARALGAATPIPVEELALAEGLFLDAPEEKSLANLNDHKRQLEAISRQIAQSASPTENNDEATLASAHHQAETVLKAWQDLYRENFASLRQAFQIQFPSHSLSPSMGEFRSDALRLVISERNRIGERAVQTSADRTRQASVFAEIETARKQLETIDSELSRISSDAGGLGAALAELSTFITGDNCPVCDRDFTETKRGSLSDHVHAKVRALSTSAQRLLDLSGTRSEQQALIDSLDRELHSLAARVLPDEVVTDISRLTALLDGLMAQLQPLEVVAADGDRLVALETAARRALEEHQSRSRVRTSAMATLTEFVSGLTELEMDAPGATEAPSAVVARYVQGFDARAKILEGGLVARRRGMEGVRKARAEIARRDEMVALVDIDLLELAKVDEAIKRAQLVRSQGQQVRSAVESVRSTIIRREFNDRLNRLWRDLFIRLAPNEPFVPEFKVPETSTQRLQPQLITRHRSGGTGGTPGAMLSAGNLNTAALTLFTALHLTVPPQLPWLILDDPVQSMDDVHIAHFAALLRTLSKEHGRQVMIAVHDRQLFEYLRLELSPAFVGDSLLTLELTRGTSRDTYCLPERLQFQEEMALQTAA
ncbi:AAA family ATPase [Tardiphaga sp.]|uniref:AAA family ATPase n=1 Tax=Tardiphaga sp. TaxID=1926292 RepID=UPI00260E5BB3|nr:AAA family ATPase [Tardiphaga sp.]MDB5620428.1 hypothetical protein [Tardiphaga sp.]